MVKNAITIDGFFIKGKNNLYGKIVFNPSFKIYKVLQHVIMYIPKTL